MKTTWIMAGTLALCAGCGASRPPPTDNLASAIAAVRGAQVAGAAQVPKASLQLRLAEEQIAQARAMIEKGQNERANYLTLRAFNDAELALALTRENEALRIRQAAGEASAQGAATP